jgi:uncharacterized protein YjbJ (UPF0337 family)
VATGGPKEPAENERARRASSDAPVASFHQAERDIDMGDDEEPSGFMEFAEGLNQAVTGVYHEAAGKVETYYGAVMGDDAAVAEGIVENAEGTAQYERGTNLMVGGINEMLGFVDHGDPNAGAGGGMPSTGGGGAGGADGGYVEPDTDQSGVSEEGY